VPRPRLPALAPRARGKMRGENFSQQRERARENHDTAEVPMKYGFSPHRAARIFVARIHSARPLCSFSRA